MTAKGKINASKVQAGDRIIVKHYTMDNEADRSVLEYLEKDRALGISSTKTGTGVTVARVLKVEARMISGGRRAQRVYDIYTTEGVLGDNTPIQTMMLAPEDAAGIKRAHVEALTEQGNRWKAGMDEIWDEALAEDAEREIAAAEAAQRQVRAWFVRHAELGTDVSRDAYAEIAYRAADHAEALAEDAAREELTVNGTEDTGCGCEDQVVAAAEQVEETPEPVVSSPAPGAAGSAVVAILERVWHLIRESNPELPNVVIVTGSAFIGPPRWAHHRASGWTGRAEKGAALTATGNRLAEMFVAGETLAKGATFTLETMLHEAAHSLACVRQVSDTSRQGRWHNAKFRNLAEELGLKWPEGKKCDSQIGYSDMLITEETKERYATLLDELEAAIHLTISGPGFLATIGEDGDTGRGGERIPGGRHGGKAKGSGGSSNSLKATCGCVEPRIIRASRKVLAEGGIGCKCCGEDFRLAE